MIPSDAEPTAALSHDELLAIAAEWMRGDHRAETLVLLKTLHARAPDDGRALYLMAAEHAALGLFDEAEAEFARAVELCPHLPEARLQYVMLLMAQRKPEVATTQLAALRATAGSRLLAASTDALEQVLRGDLDAAELAAQGLESSVASEQALCASVKQFLATVVGQLRAEQAERGPRYLGGYARLAG